MRLVLDKHADSSHQLAELQHQVSKRPAGRLSPRLCASRCVSAKPRQRKKGTCLLQAFSPASSRHASPGNQSPCSCRTRRALHASRDTQRAIVHIFFFSNPCPPRRDKYVPSAVCGGSKAWGAKCSVSLRPRRSV
eukprot:Tamp_27060.p2 GENE.Tamp_27060~~Tamp_27060.p2  ORF type:complete len:135 (+),score=0.49 Tamp_27060:99-503(+)